MTDNKTVTIISDKREVVLNVDAILYVKMDRDVASFHLSRNESYKTKLQMFKLEPMLGDGFIKVNRGCLVAAIAIHEISDRIYLNNGEVLDYAVYNKASIIKEFQSKQQKVIKSFHDAEKPSSEAEYREHYRVFDTLPIAFADIEMIFDSEFRAVDWVFRYANPALARLEKLPLDKLMGNTFRTLFPDMDSKWLRTYERVILYGETLKIIDHSPEIDTYLDIICFPTFKGHCGCILFDIAELRSFRNATNTEKALAVFFDRLLKGN